MNSAPLFFAILALAAINAAAATWDQLPAFHGIAKVDPKFVKEQFEERHPWKQGMPLPRSFEEAGLTRPVTLVAASFYFDGGSRSYLFRGENGKFLVCCTDAGFYAGKDHKVEDVIAPRLFLGTFHFSQKPRTAIPAQSDTEKFLLAALAAEATSRASQKK